jgi:hypothetical protein
MIYLCLCPALLLRWLAVSSNNILRLQIQQTIPISLEKNINIFWYIAKKRDANNTFAKSLKSSSITIAPGEALIQKSIDPIYL